RAPRALPSFPTRRSSDLPCSGSARERLAVQQQEQREHQRLHQPRKKNRRKVDSHEAGNEAPRRKYHPIGQRCDKLTRRIAKRRADRKSTRLNSSHVKISY